MIETVSIYLTLPILIFAVFLCLLRLIRGPHLPDRVIALDLMASIGIGIIATYAIARDNAVLLDIALVSALLAFLSTVAFGYYLERSDK